MSAVNRREFVTWLAATAALAACKKGAGEDTDLQPTVVPPPTGPYTLDTWYADMAMAREVLQASPDHLHARAAQLVGSRDAAGIHALVQREIRLVPVTPNAIADVDLVAMHWGPDAALRSGAGTAREQGELLLKLYRDAGFQAELLARRVTLDEATLAAMLTAGLDRDAVPVLDAEQEARLRRAPGVLAPELSLTTPSTDEATTLAAMLGQLAFPGEEASFSGGAQALFLPVVRVTIDGSPTWADPLLPEAALGTLIADDGEDSAYALDLAPELPDVEVQLLWTQARDSREATVLVEHTWKADELVGTSINASLVPVAPLAELAYAPRDAIELWQPVLAVGGSTVAMGTPWSTAGEPVDIDLDAGTLTWAGKQLEVAGDPTLAARVARLTVSTQVGSFPDVRLRVGAYDANGEPVEGLTGAQFVVEEEGQRVFPTLTANLRTGRRVLIVADNSGSVDPAFRDEGFVQLVADLYDATALVEPDVRWAVAPILFGAAPQGDFTDDRAALLAQTTGFFADGSELWAALGDAGRYDADAVILITDGLSNDVRTDVNPAALSSCPPVIAVHASLDGEGADTLAEIVALLGGVVVTPSQVTGIAQVLATTLASETDAWYQLDYSAPRTGPAERAVTAAVGSAPLAMGSYTVPELPVVRELAPVSLRLRVRVGDRELTRVLAGLPDSGYLERDPAVLASAKEQVRDALGLGATLCIEGPGATFTQALDQLVGERLTTRPAAEWMRNQRPLDELPEAMDASGSPRPSSSVALLQHTADPRIGGVPTAPLGVQIVLESNRLKRLPSGDVQAGRVVDLLPLTPWSAVGATGEASRQATLEACIRQALAEGALPGTSTFSQLAGQPLVRIPTYTNVHDVIPGLSDADQEAWVQTLAATQDRVHLVPASGALLGAWAIDPQTGTALGLLPGGAGGSVQFSETVQVLQGYLAFAGALGSAIGVPAQWGGLAALTLFHIRMWGIASAMLESLTVYPSTMTEVEICVAEQEVRELVCNVIKAFLLGPVGALDTLIGAYDLFATASSGSSFCTMLTAGEQPEACFA